MIRTILLACAASAAAAFAGHAGCGDGAPPRHHCLSAAPAQAETTVDGRRGAVAAGDGRRRALLLGTAVLPAAWASRAGPSRAAAKVRPDDAYASLVAARRELQVAGDTYLAKKDWDGLRAYLRDEAANMNGYEVGASRARRRDAPWRASATHPGMSRRRGRHPRLSSPRRPARRRCWNRSAWTPNRRGTSGRSAGTAWGRT